MKKIIILSLVLLMCFSLNLSVCATEDTETITIAQSEETHPIYDPEIDTAIDECELTCPSDDLSPGICACDACKAEAARLEKEAAKAQKKETSTKTSTKKNSKKNQTTEAETVASSEVEATISVPEESTEAITEIATETAGENFEKNKEPSVIGWIVGGVAVAVVGIGTAVIIKKKKSK